MKKEYLSYITVGWGSSWGYGDTPAEAVSIMLINLKDWIPHYRLSEWPIMPYIYDVTDYCGFVSDDKGVYGRTAIGEYTDNPLAPHSWAVCVTPKYISKKNKSWSSLRACESALKATFYSSYELADEALRPLRKEAA